MRLNCLFLTFGVCVLFSNLKAQNRCHNCGAAVLAARLIHDGLVDSNASPELPDRKFWQRDSMVIVEGRTIQFKTVMLGNTPKRFIRATIDKYIFIDLKKKWFYIYRSLSDTSALIEKFPQPDTGEVKGGWKFFSKKEIISRNNLKYISDTTISGFLYKRTTSIRISHVDTGIVKALDIGYQRCDKKGSAFIIDVPLSSQMACPYVREDIIEKSGNGMSVQWLYLTQKLTPQMMKLFAAWKKNEEKYPVTANK